MSTFRKVGGAGSNMGSGGEESVTHNTPREKKKVDHIKLLEKRMTAKFKKNSLTKS